MGVCGFHGTPIMYDKPLDWRIKISPEVVVMVVEMVMPMIGIISVTVGVMRMIVIMEMEMFQMRMMVNNGWGRMVVLMNMGIQEWSGMKMGMWLITM